MAGTLFLDDLHVGQRFAAGPLTVTDEDIISFATAFDPQPFHLDAEAAKATLFRGLVASGWHTAALTMRLLTEGGMPISTGIIGVGGEIAWPHPVRAGDELRVESEILEITPVAIQADTGDRHDAQPDAQPERRDRAGSDREAVCICAAAKLNCLAAES